jgi:hypothetical protein
LPDQRQCREGHDGKNGYHPGHITVSFPGNDHSDRLRKVTRFVRSRRVRDPAFGDTVVTDSTGPKSAQRAKRAARPGDMMAWTVRRLGSNRMMLIQPSSCAATDHQ